MVHQAAVCDRCMTRIQGEWFRCAYCAKDLCDACEAVDTHDNTHAFIVFKSMVRLSARFVGAVLIQNCWAGAGRYAAVQVSRFDGAVKRRWADGNALQEVR